MIIDGRITAFWQFLEGVARAPILIDSNTSYNEKTSYLANEAKNDKFLKLDQEFMGYLNMILDYDSYLFDTVVYYDAPTTMLGNPITNTFVQTMIVSILFECIKI